MSIMGNMVGGAAPLKTLIIEDENGTEMVGVVTGSEVVFTANSAKDIREGTVAATEEGVVTGSKVIPSYETTTGSTLILPSESFSISLPERNKYDYTQMQCVIVLFNSDYNSNITTENIAMYDQVYSVASTEKISDITKNAETKSVDLNITNNTNDVYEIFYFTYREEE